MRREIPPGQKGDRKHTIMVIYGTRPEAVKMAPMVWELTASPFFTPYVAVTGQHRSMLDQVNDVFGISPDIDLDIHQAGQTLTDITTRSIKGITAALTHVQPDAVVVQGDTTSTFAAALAAFYQQIPVIHLEAGLRTGERYAPFPEEINRRLTTQLTSLHLAPTATSRDNLLAENVDPGSVVVTGNTVIDALLWTVGQAHDYADPGLADLDHNDRPVLLVTAHRRESWGEPLRSVGKAVARIAAANPDLLVVFPLHRNPLVRQAVMPELTGRHNVRLIDPVPYANFARLMNRSTLILTDSGGVQEEGPSLGKPVLVMRESTERPEAIDAGTAMLVGTDTDRIVNVVTTLLAGGSEYTGHGQRGQPLRRRLRRRPRRISPRPPLRPRPPADEFAPVGTATPSQAPRRLASA